jgi:hypothetical protein
VKFSGRIVGVSSIYNSENHRQGTKTGVKMAANQNANNLYQRFPQYNMIPSAKTATAFGNRSFVSTVRGEEISTWNAMRRV